MTNTYDSRRTTDALVAHASAQQEPSSTEEWRERMQEAGKEVGQKAQEMGQKVQELTTQGQEVAAEYYQQGRERVLAWQQQLQTQVREKPLQTLLMAAGIGLLFGLLRRR
jgi:ElaB/YqjD/DUF883 family membrane-anchored ribosome-binding protein